MDAPTAAVYSEQGNMDITELMVIDEMTQCEKCKEHNAKGMSFLHMRSNSAGIFGRKEHVERNNGASDDSLMRFVVANQDTRSDKALQSKR